MMSMSRDDPNNSQMALALLFEQKPEILKKPVQAVHMAITGGIQSKTQRLAFNAMLKHALEEQARNPGEKVDTYSISRVELMRTINYTSPNRKHLKDTLTAMQKLTVQWDYLRQDGDSIWGSCVLLPFVGFDRDKIYYSYSPQIKPMLLEPKIYARLDLRIQRAFRLDASAALYEWVNRFRTNPSKLTNEMGWEEWRWVIYGEVNEKSVLNEYKIFKREKLKPAILEINEKSDLAITLHENRDGGRSVKYLQFTVEEKDIFKLEQDGDKDASSGGRAEWDKRLENLGVSPRDRKKILDSYSLEDVEAGWQFTTERVNDKTKPAIKSPAAYLKRALEGKYAPEAPAQKPIAGGGGEIEAMKDIQARFSKKRHDDAAAMFVEMPDEDREAAVAEYNALQEVSVALIPATASKRTARLMVPFYGWLAKKYWGEPTAQEIFEFAVTSGAISINR
ncbi:replication initiator protein [Herbaspirillum sp. SJZ107]|nr:replication initiator protein [Herbaspirillum sp. SJZ107]